MAGGCGGAIAAREGVIHVYRNLNCRDRPYATRGVAEAEPQHQRCGCLASLKVNLTGSIKDRIARSMIERAGSRGKLRPGMSILESTSGNTGIALAMVARIKGYRSAHGNPGQPVRRNVWSCCGSIGGEIVGSPGDQGSNGAVRMAQRTRGRPAGSLLLSLPVWRIPPIRRRIIVTDPELSPDLPTVDVFVAGLGTGGP